MKVSVLLIIMYVMVSPINAQNAIIHGQVIDADTKQPVHGAIVVFSALRKTTFTDKAGHFEFNVGENTNALFSVEHIAFAMTKIIHEYSGAFVVEMRKIYRPINSVYLRLYPRNIEKIPITRPLGDGKQFGLEQPFTEPPEGFERFRTSIGNEFSRRIGLYTGEAFNVKFTINEDGKATDIYFSDSTDLKSVDSTTSVARTLKEILYEMPPWVPGKFNGVALSQHFRLPLHPTGGLNELMLDFDSWIARGIRYTSENRRKKIEGVVCIQFGFDENGNPINPIIVMNMLGNTGNDVKAVISSFDRLNLQAFKRFFNVGRFQAAVQFSPRSPFEKVSLPINDSTYQLPLVVVQPDVQEMNAFPSEYSITAALKKARVTRQLNVSGMGLTFFPAEITGCKNLEYLNLDNNYISVLPLNISSLQSLQELSLYQNNIDTLPQSISKLRKLIAVNLASNNLTEFPDQLMIMKNIKWLCLSDNDIKSIPSAIKNMKQLKTLIIRGNPITKDDVEKLRAGMPKVKIIF
jgi:hypothetical protein